MKYPKLRLSALMFVQFFIWGATNPIISLYLKECLNFNGAQIGLILGVSAVGAIFSPLFMTFIADRVISSERLLALLNLIAGIFMYIFSRQTEFYGALAAYTIYCIAIIPTVPLISAITFRHSTQERSKFGNIRVWGTLGWLAVAWTFGFGVMPNFDPALGSPLPMLLDISAVTAIIMAAYSLTLPAGRIILDIGDGVDGEDIGKNVGAKIDTSGGANKDSADNNASNKTLHAKTTSRRGSRLKKLFPAGAFRVIMTREVFAISLIATALTFVDKFYSFGTAPFLKQSGFSDKDIMPAMSLGQLPEIVAMGILAILLKKWGAKAVLLLGIGLGIFRFGVCAIGGNHALICVGLSVHGLVYTFTMITAVICIDAACSDRERTGVHQLFTVLTSGAGAFLGSYAAGITHDIFTNAETGVVNYGAYWLVPLFVSILIFAYTLRTRRFKADSCGVR